MKFLIDNQLPVTLAQHLKNRGFECRHVLHEHLADADDAQICRYAEAHDFIIISKD